MNWQVILSLGAIKTGKDIFELSLLTYLVYVCCIWLKKDKQTPLLLYFYGFCSLFFISVGFHLPTLIFLLVWSAPIFAIFAIIFHQDILQRNFIFYKRRINLEQHDNQEWSDILIRACLMRLNQAQDLLVIIEHTSQLDTLLASEFKIRAPVSPALLEVCMHSSKFNPQKYMWLTSTGILTAVNAQWTFEDQHAWQTDTTKELPLWKQDALLITLKTDAFIFKIIPEKRYFDVVVQGKIFEHVSATHVLQLMKKHLGLSDSKEGTLSYENSSKHSSSQRTL